MARGWESKEVESQQELAAERAQRTKLPGLTPEQMELETKRDSLELQRKRVLRELELCKNDRVRKTIESGLAFLEAQLAGLTRAQEN